MTQSSMITMAAMAALALLAGSCCGQAEMQMRAKRAEAPANLDAIRTAEMAYHAEWDTYLAAGWTPSEIPGKTAVAFEGGDLPAFQNLGWYGWGDVYCRYRVTNVVTDAENPQNDSFEAVAECDIDGDGEIARYVATPDSSSTLQSAEDVY